MYNIYYTSVIQTSKTESNTITCLYINKNLNLNEKIQEFYSAKLYTICITIGRVDN